MKMNYLRASFKNTWDFLKNTKAYFRDVLLMHGLLLFVVIPLLSSSTKFILKQGNIPYISNDNIGKILIGHPVVTVLLLVTLLLILLLVFFEFTFLLLSVYFIEKKQPVSLRQLLRMTLIQIKKLRPSVFLFFLFYFLLILPIGGLNFNSDLLSKVKIPSFIMDFIFTNRLIIVSSFIVFYLLMLYIGIRVIFALPEMILRDQPFRAAVKDSLAVTKRRFLSILGRFLFIGGTILLLTGLGFILVISLQALIENLLPSQALYSAVFAMTLLQFFLLLNIVLSTVGIFYIIVDFMNDEGFLPEVPTWFYREPLKENRYHSAKNTLIGAIVLFFGIGVALYNLEYLTDTTAKTPVTVSHRGVSGGNGIQNTIPAMIKTSQTYHPDFVEMDIQMTTDKHFVVMHDFNLKHLAGINKKPEEMTYRELLATTIKENGQTSKIDSFDEYLAKADSLHQKLLVEIKTQKSNTKPIVSEFLKRYSHDLQANGHMIHSLSYSVVEEVKHRSPFLTVGYILPFNVVGPPTTSADFLTMEYSTINRNFIEAAHQDGKRVFVWTPNNQDDDSRMMFYGVDGIITDEMGILNDAVKTENRTTYSDKLLNFVIGVG